MQEQQQIQEEQEHEHGHVTVTITNNNTMTIKNKKQEEEKSDQRPEMSLIGDQVINLFCLAECCWFSYCSSMWNGNNLGIKMEINKV